MISYGIVSYICPWISTVLQSWGPQTSQQGLCHTFPPTQSSSSRSFIQILLDFNGTFWNSVSEICPFSKITLIPSGANDCFRVNTAFSISCSVDPHLGQVSPLDIKRFHLIFTDLAEFLSSTSEGEHSQLFPLLSIYTYISSDTILIITCFLFR